MINLKHNRTRSPIPLHVLFEMEISLYLLLINTIHNPNFSKFSENIKHIQEETENTNIQMIDDGQSSIGKSILTQVLIIIIHYANIYCYNN